MIRLFVLFIFMTAFFACSKEEEIPYKPADTDSLDVVYYYSIKGEYKGIIRDIQWVSASSYQVLDERSYHVVVEELSFDVVKLRDISDKIESDADAEMSRFDQTGGYLMFIPNTMTDSTGVDSVFYSGFFGEYYNGIYYYGSDRLQYFFHFIQQKDTVFQVFEGTLLP